MMQASIPLNFYEVTSVVYLLASVVCFLVAFFSYKTYKMEGKKKILLLLFGFLLLGLSFLVLAAPSLYIYFGLTYYQQTSLSINYISYVGFTTYYALSAVAYVLFLIMYFPRLKTRSFIIFVPLWYANSVNFHVLSIAILALVVMQNVINWFRKKSLNSCLVVVAFLSLVLFHLLLLFTTFSITNFIVANGILIIGFLSLLAMLIRVNYGGKKIKA